MTTHSFDKVKLYRIDYEKLDALYDQNEDNEEVNLTLTGGSELTTVQGQIEPFSIKTIEEINKENGANTSTKKREDGKKSVGEKRELTLQEKREGSARILKTMENNMAKKTKRKGSKFTKTPTLEIWYQAYKENYDRDIKHFTGKEAGQLKNVDKGYPEDYENMVKACLSDWRGFCIQVMSETDLDRTPPEPHTGFFCTYARQAYHFYQEQPLEGSSEPSSGTGFSNNRDKFLNNRDKFLN